MRNPYTPYNFAIATTNPPALDDGDTFVYPSNYQGQCKHYTVSLAVALEIDASENITFPPGLILSTREAYDVLKCDMVQHSKHWHTLVVAIQVETQKMHCSVIVVTASSLWCFWYVRHWISIALLIEAVAITILSIKSSSVLNHHNYSTSAETIYLKVSLRG